MHDAASTLELCAVGDSTRCPHLIRTAQKTIAKIILANFLSYSVHNINQVQQKHNLQQKMWEDANLYIVYSSSENKSR